MLCVGWNVDNVARFEFHRSFVPFLIIAAAADCNEYLTAASCSMMNMPVVSAFGFKRNIYDPDLLC